ncbi:sulfatase [Lentisphaera marina]|uniref:sulfatase family protein n=1 Tax=Lentisphaera marina TaxID=1111041 RepID=UPI002365195A|nr:sulfatase [Lentisphaera marina]MDD7987212.1 sulfatase [Lentisphaera marina]
MCKYILIMSLLILSINAEERPNILFAIADDMSHAACFGDAWVNTPNLDRLAKEGILFEHAFVSNPKCGPSRASTLGGRHFWQMQEAAIHWSQWPSKIKIYTDILAENGYHVGYTGKGWGPGRYNNVREHNPAGKAWNKIKNEAPTKLISTTDYAANFKEFLNEKKADQPFCFWYGAKEPHRAYTKGSGVKSGLNPASVKVPAYYPDHPEVRSDLLDYALEINWFDHHLGLIVKHLEEIGELDNTIIIAFSDNGAPFPRIKGQIYDDDIHLPMIARWGKVHKGGDVVKDFVSNIDLGPTFLEAAGIAIPAEMSGKSFLDIFHANKSGYINPARNFVCVGRENHDLGREGDKGYPVRAIRTEKFLYIRNFAEDSWPSGNPETGFTNIDSSPTKNLILELHEKGNSKYFNYTMAKRPKEELFRVDQDSDCVHNLANNPEYSAIKEKLWKQLSDKLKATNDPRMGSNPDVFDEYEYVGKERAKHSWEAYEKKTFKKQTY